MRIAPVLGLLAVLAVAACSSPVVLQESVDGRVQVTNRMLRTTFDQFCRSPKAEGRCAAYSEYAYTEIYPIGDDGVGLWFIYERALENPNIRTEKLVSIGCWWRPESVECQSGEHSY